MADVVLTGGRVLRAGAWVDQDLRIRDGRVTEPTDPRPDDRRVEVDGLLLAPGLIDLQCNGALGIDVTSGPAAMWELAAALPRWGVTAWLPTVVTAAPGAVDAALAVLAAGPPPGWTGAQPLGLHLEGPLLAPDARGAHPAEHLRAPSAEAVAGWARDRGVALVTLAPELPGALDAIEALVAHGVVVSLGHSRATAAQASPAVDAGATWVTHLFNAMAPLHHREPGLVGLALTDERLRVGLIADGVHVHPAVVALAQRLLGPRLSLVTDAVRPMGTPRADGDGGVRTAAGVLAGSTCPLDAAARNLVRFAGCSSAEAVAAATTTPAAVLGDHERGTLDPGARADLVVLTPELDLVGTWIAGTPVHPAP